METVLEIDMDRSAASDNLPGPMGDTSRFQALSPGVSSSSTMLIFHVNPFDRGICKAKVCGWTDSGAGNEEIFLRRMTRLPETKEGNLFTISG